MSKGSTKPDIVSRLESMKPHLETRARLISSIRSFFTTYSFLEVETPVLADSLAPEEYIEAPAVGNRLLRTSPELQMKLMLSAGYEKIFQVGPCFREGELGRRHRPEFTMLEWYCAGWDYMRLLDFTRKMLLSAVNTLTGNSSCVYNGVNIDFAGNWSLLTVDEAFRRFAGVPAEEAAQEDCFEELLVEKVEPQLPSDKPTVLYDYPSRFSALARLKKDQPSVCERWELYLGGIEIANAYSELNDPIEQKARFKEAVIKRKSAGMKDYPDTEEFFKAMEYGMPDSSGCALGIDRLSMIFTDNSEISKVLF